MFFREAISKNSKSPVLQLVENIRTEKGPRQRLVVSLGTYLEIPKEKRREVACIVKERLFGEFANGASFEGIYEKWDKEGKLIPIFDLFLEPPTPMDVDREAFAWYSSHVVFHREIWDNESRDHWIYIGDLVSVELIDSYRRQIRTIICDDSIASDDLRRKCIEERIEKIIEYHAPHSKERIHEILEQISIILQKPSLASSNENPDNSYKKLL